MVRIFLILSLAVALAGVGFSFVLKDKVTGLAADRDKFRQENETNKSEAQKAKAGEKKAKEAEKAAKDELEGAKGELAATTAKLSDVESKLVATAKDLDENKVARETAQRKLARWEALSIQPDQIAALKTNAQMLLGERNALAEEKKVMGRQIARLSEELNTLRGPAREVEMPDVRGLVTSVNENYRFVVLNVGSEDGLKKNGKMIVTRGDSLLGKLQLVRVEARTSVANLISDTEKGSVKEGDHVMTSYEALPK